MSKGIGPLRRGTIPFSRFVDTCVNQILLPGPRRPVTFSFALSAANRVVLSTDTVLYAFSPKMSYVSKEFASADPDFWSPKPKAAQSAPAPAKSGGAKTAAKQ